MSLLSVEQWMTDQSNYSTKVHLGKTMTFSGTLTEPGKGFLRGMWMTQKYLNGVHRLMETALSELPVKSGSLARASSSW